MTAHRQPVALNLPTDEAFLTTEEVLEYLSVNLRTVYRLIKAGSIPAVRVGRQWRFRKRDLDQWLERQRSGEGRTQVSPPVPAPARRRVLLVDDEENVRTAAVGHAGIGVRRGNRRRR